MGSVMRVRSSADIGVSVTFIPSAAAISATVPRVGFTESDDRSRRTVLGSEPIAPTRILTTALVLPIAMLGGNLPESAPIHAKETNKLNGAASTSS